MESTVVNTPLMSLRGASLGYDHAPVIRDLDLALSAGEFLAVLGPNGSGKSTLLKGMLRLARLSAGSLTVFGMPAPKFRQWHRIGYVPQRAPTDKPIPATVSEVVATGRLARKGAFRWLSADDKTAIDRAMQLVGVAALASTPVPILSGGQQRRVLVARALAAQPDVLLLDEPLAGVDAANQELLADTLGGLVSNGTTVLIVTHELGPLEPTLSRVAVMREGVVTYDGPLQGAPAPDESFDPHCAPAARPSGLTRLGL